MNKTKIEWCDYTVNPVKGYCPVGCTYCYARAMYDRFGWDKTIRYDFGAWVKGVNILTFSKPSRIFVGSTFELFGEWVKPHWLQDIFLIAKAFPQHTFIFLSKRPWDLPKWSPWPDNAWVGVSVPADGDMTLAITNLANVQAGVRFISFEPLLGSITMSSHKMKGIIDWLIIGAQTNPNRQPKLEWVEEIVEAADKAGIPAFLKNNLHLDVSGKDTWALSPNVGKGELWRQEFPEAVLKG